MRMLVKHPVKSLACCIAKFLAGKMNFCSARGLTMMEVLVAISVLSIGSMALLQIFSAFNRIRVVEKTSVLAITSEIGMAEYFIRNPTSCVDGPIGKSENIPGAESPAKNTAEGVAAGVELLPGPVAGLLWLKTEHFRRLVECR